MTPDDSTQTEGAPAIHRAVVDRLVADVRPVRPLWPVRARLAAWWVFALGGTVAVLAIGGGRADLALRAREPLFLAYLATLLTAATLLAGLALRAAVPGRGTRRGELVLAIALVAGVMALALAQPADVATPEEFVRSGITCTGWTFAIAALPWLALVLAVSRGAPIRAGLAGAEAGAASVLLAAFTLRMACPLEGRFHLVTWHLMPVLLGAAFSAAIGVVWLGRGARPRNGLRHGDA